MFIERLRGISGVRREETTMFAGNCIEFEPCNEPAAHAAGLQVNAMNVLRFPAATKSILATILAAAALLLHACAGGFGPTMNDDRFATVQTGMKKDEVLQLLGRPQQTMKFPLNNTESWDYIGQDTWGYMVDYAVVFGPDGRVVNKVARRLNDGGDHGSK
jgi:outer membrane protein assembly factor BamE (lipoprotein component of BamABCDE complex)